MSRLVGEGAASFTLLGCGTSVGVPVIGCECVVCRSNDPRNQRTRAGACLRRGETTILFDAPPELRLQLTRARVGVVHATFFTHAHADHLFGLDDLRICGFRLGQAVPLYCEAPVERTIRDAFSYAFSNEQPSHPFAVPRFTFQRIAPGEPVHVAGETILPIRLYHGRLPVLGFRMRNLAYCTDVNHIPPESLPLLQGLDVLVLDALRFDPHPTHFCLDEALEVVAALRPRRAVLTHLSHDFDYTTTSARLPKGVELAYDGLEIPLGKEPGSEAT